MSALEILTFMFAALAVLFAAVWWRDREPGLQWLALAFAGWTVLYLQLGKLPAGEVLLTSPEARALGLLVSSAVVLSSFGVGRYLAPLTPRAGLWLGLCCAPVLLVVATLLASPQALPRWLLQAGLTLAYIGPAVLAWRRHRVEPGAGHALLAVVLVSVPLMPVVLVLAGVEATAMRTLGALSVLLFGLILLTVSLLRRRRALESEVARRERAEQALRQSNAELEQRVADRTAHLAEVVSGLEAFSRSVSHDLRGPLGGVASLARLAHERLAAGESALALQSLPLIATQADNAVNLVNTLLGLARIGEAGVRRRRMSLAALVQEAVGTVGLGSGSAGVRIVVEPLPEIVADPDLLRPVLVNLIGNAVKFSRLAPSPEVRVQARVVGDAVEVGVRDNGVGFEAAETERLFEPFRRGHEGRFEGYGLGLNIVRRAVQLHGGRVQATSAPGQGATFTFSIPGGALAVGPSAGAEGPAGAGDAGAGRHAPGAAAAHLS